VDCNKVVLKVVDGLYNKIETTLIDDLAAETCAFMIMIHPDYSYLAARIAATKLHKETHDNFFETAKTLHYYVENDRDSS